MTNAACLATVHRGGFEESVHLGHAVVVDNTGRVVEAWGDPDLTVLPRSSVKMIQALPLVESGAAEGLHQDRLALACASHQAERLHVHLVDAWMAEMGLPDDAFRCGPQESRDREYRHQMIREDEPVRRVHNNCSGKHAGFLALTGHLKAGPDYVDPAHPVQVAVRAAFEDVTGEASPGFGIDGCSAPNFATSMTGLARAMARFAAAREDGDARARAMVRLREAMMARPDLVAGSGRACTAIMRAAPGRLAVKTGAEGVFTAILPERGLGVAVKVADGATRASEAAVAAILVRLGAVDADHPDIRALLDQPIRNWDGLVTGAIRAAPELEG